MLTEQELAQYRQRLLNLRKDIDAQLDALEEWCEPVAPDVGLGRLTRTDAMQDQQMALHQRERLRAQQTRITTALARVDAGTFGICPMCKQPIDPRRLATTPDAPLCVACVDAYNARKKG